MSEDEVPFGRIWRVLNEARAVEAPKASRQDFKLGELINLAELAVQFAPDQQDPDDEDGPNYTNTRRVMRRKFKEIREGYSKTFQALKELCALLKLAIEHNLERQFCDEAKQKSALLRIDQEMEIIEREVEKYRKEKARASRLRKAEASRKDALKPSTASEYPLPSQGGSTPVKVTRWMNEIYNVLERLDYLATLSDEEEKKAIPDFVEERLWDEEYEEMIAVRKAAFFQFRGDVRDVVFAILETPLSKDAHVIRLGTDYWMDAEYAFECNDEAFFVKECAGLEDAIAVVMSYLNEEEDLGMGVIRDSLAAAADESPPSYETQESLNRKLSYLLG